MERQQHSAQPVLDFVQQVEVSADLSLHFPSGLVAVPLIVTRAAKGGEPDCSEVLHVTHALEQGLVRVEETKPAEVGRLPMLNLSKQPVLVPAGAVLKGGAQTRIVASPVLLLGQSVHHIDVRCVERGRWTPHAPAVRGLRRSSALSADRQGPEVGRPRREFCSGRSP